MTSNKEFKKYLFGQKLIILGEMHGAEVNPKVVDTFVKALGVKHILIEIEGKYEKPFLLLKKREVKKFLLSLQKDSWIFKAGLLGTSHIKLFQKYLRNGMRVIPVKVESKNWNIAETKTARNIEKVLSSLNDSSPALLVFGHLHARKAPFYLEGNSYKPLGFLLRKKAISVQVRYAVGEIFNFKNIKIEDDIAKKLIANNIKGLTASTSRFFDYFYIVPSTKMLKLVRYK